MTARPKSEIRAPSSVAAFVAQGDARPVVQSISEPVDQSTKQPVDREPKARKGVVSRVRKGDLDRITAYLPVDLGAQIRMTCAAQRLELSEAIAEAVRAWLAKR